MTKSDQLFDLYRGHGAGQKFLMRAPLLTLTGYMAMPGIAGRLLHETSDGRGCEIFVARGYQSGHYTAYRAVHILGTEYNEDEDERT